MTRILGIDPGSSESGMCMIEGKKILHASNEKNSDVFRKAKELAGSAKIELVIEDLQPFLMRLTPHVISTAKFIGELCYRFNTCDFVSSLHLVPRNSVKKWVFDTQQKEVLARVGIKMNKLDKKKVADGGKGLRKDNGEMRLASFHYVDDRIIIAALKKIFNVPTPKPGKKNIYNLHSHSWQAMACAGYVALKK